jgi:hypothetical protein
MALNCRTRASSTGDFRVHVKRGLSCSNRKGSKRNEAAHDLFYPALDLLIVAGILRDLIVDGRVNRIYLYVFPAILVLQAWATYLERVNPTWWQAATRAILAS